MAHVHCKCGFVKKNIPDKHIGRKAKCPKCKTSVPIKKNGAPRKSDKHETSQKESVKTICPKCGYGNTQRSESCPKCGIIYEKWVDKTLHASVKKNVPDKQQEQPKEVINGLTQCPECKEKINKDNDFCPKCGYQLSKEEPDGIKVDDQAVTRGCTIGCLALIVIFVILAVIGSFLPDDTTTTKPTKQHFSAWDGSHYGLTEFIKKSMNDPSSYEHVETVYWEESDHLIVKTTFRGKNAFGGTVNNWVKAKVDLNGNVIEVIEQGL